MSDDRERVTPDPIAAEPVAAAGAAAVGELTRDVARARAASALFGREVAVTVGRYRLIERVGAGGMGVVWSAFDPELGRAVALKLASAGEEAARARVRTEGRVLAKLSHPNVVPIYDVVDSEHGVFLVMELVRGQTLRALAQQAPAATRTRTLLRAYRQAAEGLAAAHAAGLIHRDFKPDNAVVGADGRVRVLDFGLALEAKERALTPSPSVAGTPRYMAPEQRAGEDSPFVDQYAFCVSLREALGEPTPRWLLPILARGTAAQPAGRFPSMAALLAALARDPATVWRRRGAWALGAAAVAALVTGALLGRQPARAPACDGGDALIAQSWGADRAKQAAHLLALRGPLAEAGGAQLLGAFDAYARTWRQQHRAVCLAEARGAVPMAQLDRRRLCLANGRTALATAARLAGAVTVAQLPDLIQATAALPELARCADDDALATPVAPPPPERAAPVAAVDHQLAAIAVLHDAARLDEALPLAERAVAEAERLAYPPLLARARLTRGRLATTGNTGDWGAADFEAATQLALTAGDDAAAIEAFARYAAAVALRGKAHPEGVGWILALAERLGPRHRFAQAFLQGNLARVALAEGDRATARARYGRAVVLAGELGGQQAAELAFARHGQLLLLDDPVEIARRSAELLALRERQLGPAHPFTLRDRAALAGLAAEDAQVLAALAPACRDLGAYPQLALARGDCAAEAALLTTLAGDRAALAEWAQALAQTSALLGSVSTSHRARAYGKLAAGEPAAALAEFRAARRDLKLGPDARFWVRAMAVELSLAAAAIAKALGDPRGLAEELAIAREQLAACRDDLAVPLVRRREAQIRALAG